MTIAKKFQALKFQVLSALIFLLIVIPGCSVTTTVTCAPYIQSCYTK